MISTDFVARDKNCPGKGKVKKGGQGLTVLYIGPISRHSSGESRRIKVKRAGKYTQESISSLPSICPPGWNIAGGGGGGGNFSDPLSLSPSLPRASCRSPKYSPYLHSLFGFERSHDVFLRRVPPPPPIPIETFVFRKRGRERRIESTRRSDRLSKAVNTAWPAPL